MVLYRVKLLLRAESMSFQLLLPSSAALLYHCNALPLTYRKSPLKIILDRIPRGKELSHEPSKTWPAVTKSKDHICPRIPQI